MQHFPVLSSLISCSELELLVRAVDYMFKHQVRLGVQDRTNVEIGTLKFYSTDALLQLTQEDFKWLSRLRYLWVGQTVDIMSMRRILESTEDVVELDLPSWTTLEKLTSSDIRSLSRNPKPVNLKLLKNFISPRDIALTVAMNQMLELDGDQTLLSGGADSLVLWKVKGLKAAFLHLVPDTDRGEVEILVEKARKFFQLSPTIQSLTLRCYRGGYGGDQHHLNKILEVLDTPSSSQPQKPDRIAGGEAAPSSAVDNLLLPHLVKLTIEDPIELDGNLLQKIVRAKTERDINFQLEFRDSETSEVVVIDDWEARGCMD
jgi:hypothetical protein